MGEPERDKIAVVIITGFLGSGKTTVLNHLVQQPAMAATAVIINEFGEIGIDHLLVETSTEQMVEINNGCICCTIRGDLADKLGSLAMWIDMGRVPPVERVVVETTGLADPAPILHTLMTDGDLLKRYRLGAVVTVVDAITGPSSLARFHEAVKQVAIADRLILSKVDLIDTHSDRETFRRLRARIGGINPRAVLHDVAKGEVDPERIIGEVRDDVDGTFAEFSSWLRASKDFPGENPVREQSHDHRHAHGDHDVSSIAVELERPIVGAAFNDFLQDLAIEFGEHLLRMKGILYVEEDPDRPAVIHGVQHVFFPVTWLKAWPDDERATKLVFITHGLAPEQIKKRFAERFS
jgi:G3E family GTPase